MKKLSGMLLAAGLIGGLFAAQASAEEANGAGVEVRMTVGSPEVFVNGERLEVKAPVVKDGTTLVPLRVITTAFGAEPQWIAETEGIVLTYNGKTVEMNIGSATSLVNGEATEMAVSPQLIDGLTMVPIRFISETFGADVTYDPETEAIGIKGVAASEAGGADGIVSDADKTKIGDGYWGWTMDYPSGLIQDYQSFDGDYISFADANGEYTIEIWVEEDRPNVKESGLLKELASYTYDTILDRRLVTDATPAYAKIVTRSSYGGYTESRAYLNDGTIYYISLYVEKDEDYRNPNKAAVYTELLNSFRPSFDDDDAAVKNVSTVSGGYVPFTDDMFGITLELPPGWGQYSDSNGIMFFSFKDDHSMYLNVSSLEEGDTLKAWVGRHDEQFKQEFVTAARELQALPDRKIDGGEAALRRRAETFGTEWMEYYDLYVIKGNYKYNFSFTYPKGEAKQVKDVIDRMIASIEIDEEAASDNLGYLDDPYGVDLTETDEYVNAKFGYSITVPAYWEESSYDPSSVMFDYRGASLQINALDNATTLSDALASVEYMLEQSQKINSSLQVTENETVTFHGMQARKIAYSAKDYDGDRQQFTMYIFERGKVVFNVAYSMYDSVMTPENNARLEAALQSLKFE